MKRIVAKLLGFAVAVGVLVAVDLFFGPLVDTWPPVRYEGRIVDATTGAPVAGAWVMAVPDRASAADESFVPTWRPRIESAQGQPMMVVGGASTADDGSFAFDVLVGQGWREGAITGIAYGRTTLPPFAGPDFLLVEAEGYRHLVVDATEGEWRESPGATEHVATLRVGDLRARR